MAPRLTSNPASTPNTSITIHKGLDSQAENENQVVNRLHMELFLCFALYSVGLSPP